MHDADEQGTGEDIVSEVVTRPQAQEATATPTAASNAASAHCLNSLDFNNSFNNKENM